MKYYTNTYSGIDNIFNDIFSKNYKNKKLTSIDNSDFVYMQKFNSEDLKKIKNIKYFNNFLDPHQRLCLHLVAVVESLWQRVWQPNLELIFPLVNPNPNGFILKSLKAEPWPELS